MTAASAARSALAKLDYEFSLTPEQRKSLIRVIRHQGPERLQGIAWSEYDGCLMTVFGSRIPGRATSVLWIGIERDGYAHS